MPCFADRPAAERIGGHEVTLVRPQHGAPTAATSRRCSTTAATSTSSACTSTGTVRLRQQVTGAGAAGWWPAWCRPEPRVGSPADEPTTLESSGTRTRCFTTPASGVFEHAAVAADRGVRAASRERRADPQHPLGAAQRADAPAGSAGGTAGTPRSSELEMLHDPALRRARCASSARRAAASLAWSTVVVPGTLAGVAGGGRHRAGRRPGGARRRMHRSSYALVRPPGHHAQPAMTDGYCLFSQHRPGGRAGHPPRRRASRHHRLGRPPRKRHAGVLLPARRRARGLAPHAARRLVRRPSADRLAARGRPGRRRSGFNLNVELPYGSGDAGLHRRPWSGWSSRSSTRSGPELLMVAGRAGREPVRPQRPPVPCRWPGSGGWARSPANSPTATATAGWC